MIQEEKRQMITPRISIDLYKKLKISCVIHGITIDEYISTAIKEKLSKEK